MWKKKVLNGIFTFCFVAPQLPTSKISIMGTFTSQTTGAEWDSSEVSSQKFQWEDKTATGPQDIQSRGKNRDQLDYYTTHMTQESKVSRPDATLHMTDTMRWDSKFCEKIWEPLIFWKKANSRLQNLIKWRHLDLSHASYTHAHTQNR